MTISIGIQNPRIANLSQLLQEGTFEVPFFQREYSWTKDHWTDFIEDVDLALKKDRGHFFGFMTLKKGESSDYEIIEGQQRITTVIIFLCAIRDLCIELGLDETKNEITKFITSASSFFKKSLPPTPKLTLSRVNKDFFKSLIQVTSTLGEKEHEFKQQIGVIYSNKLIFDCYKYFHKNLSQKIEGHPLDRKDKNLNFLAGSALENFFVAVTEVNDHLVAYNMFQTINDRGLDLTL
jgi:uncharacterized protein with ParB-like and HNH nuclease domain